jgi:D-serine deaminase-like pyridoxal phosphate-dependent protein
VPALISELETPVAIVDLDRMEAAIARLQKYLSEHKIANRPHIKTHRIPEIALMQVKAGAIGITCQKLAEAEIMADAGIADIFLPYNIVGTTKLARLLGLVKRVRMAVTADSETTIRGLSGVMGSAGVSLPVLVEFDTGLGRCGVATPGDARTLARLIAQSPGLKFGGLMTHPHNDNSDPFVAETRGLLKADSIPVETVSYGSTSGMWKAHTRKEVTEYRAGVYVYGDRDSVRHGVLTPDECALRVVMTVVSRPTADRGILDGGSKALSSDLLGLDGHGTIEEYPEARIAGLSEEHGNVDFSKCSKKPAVGDRVTVQPNHGCVVGNLFNQMVVVRNGKVEVTWKVAARGASY